MPQRIVSTITTDDHVVLNKCLMLYSAAHARRRTKRYSSLVISTIIGGVLGYAIVLAVSASGPAWMRFGIFPALLAFLLGWMLVRERVPKTGLWRSDQRWLDQVRKSIESGQIDAPRGEQTIEISDDSVVAVIGSVRTEYPWSSIIDVRELDEHLVLAVSAHSGLTIPRSAFVDQAGYEQCATTIRARAGSVDGLTRL